MFSASIDLACELVCSHPAWSRLHLQLAASGAQSLPSRESQAWSAQVWATLMETRLSQPMMKYAQAQLVTQRLSRQASVAGGHLPAIMLIHMPVNMPCFPNERLCMGYTFKPDGHRDMPRSLPHQLLLVSQLTVPGSNCLTASAA